MDRLMKRNMHTRIIAAVLAVAMIVTMIPFEVLGAVGSGSIADARSYDAQLLAEMTALYEGNQEKAIEALDALYADGLIDEEGNMVFGDTFLVDDAEVTKEELREMAEKADSGTEVVVDGTSMTWGDLKQMFTVSDAMDLIKDCEESEVPLTQEHIAAIKSFSEQLGNGSLTIGNLKTADAQRTSAGDTIKVYVKEDGNGMYSVDTDQTEPEVLKQYYLQGNPGTAISESQIQTDADGSFIEVFVNTEDGSFLYGVKPRAAISQTKSGDKVTYTAALENELPYDVSMNVRILDGSYSEAVISEAEEGEGKEYTLTIPAGETVGEFSVQENATETNEARKWKGDNCYVVVINTDEMEIKKSGKEERFFDSLSWSCKVNGTTEKSSLAGEESFKMNHEITGGTIELETLQTYRTTEAVEGIKKDPFTASISLDELLNQVEGLKKDDLVTIKIDSYKLSKFSLFVACMWPDGDPKSYDTRSISSLTGGTGATINQTTVKMYTLIGETSKATTPAVGSEKVIVNEGEDVRGPNYDVKKALGHVVTAPVSQLRGKYFITKATNVNYKVDTGSSIISCYPFFAPDFNAPVTLTLVRSLPTLVKPEIIIPDGVFYPGDVIPITVQLNKELHTYAEVDGKNMKLTVQGEELTPEESDGSCADELTYLYTVKDMDQLSITVDDFQCTGNNPEDKSLSYSAEAFEGASNNNCKLNTPDKKLTFMADTNDDGKPDSLSEGMEFIQNDDGSYRLYIPVFNDKRDPDSIPSEELSPEKNSQQYFAWLASNLEQDKKTGDFHVKSMYGSTDGGKTKLPFYVDVDYEEFEYVDPLTGETVKYSEKPVGIYLDFMPQPNLSNQYTLGSLELFMDRDIASATDYVAEEEEFAAPILAEGWSFSYFVEPSILFEEGDVTLKYDYNKTWNAFVPENAGDKAIEVFDYQIAKAEADLVLSYDIAGNKEYTYPEAEHFIWSSSDPTVAMVINKKITYYHNEVNVCKNIAAIIPTGKEGEVFFTLTVGNGSSDYAIKLESDKVVFREGTEPYITVPKLAQEVITIQNEAADVYFSTNITSLNAKETENPQHATDIELTVYPCDGKGNASGDKIYQTKKSATLEEPITGFTIPENYLDIVSAGDYSYRAEIAIVDEASGQTMKAHALIKVKAAPIKMQINLKNNYVLDKENLPVTWNIRNVNMASANKEWYYVVTSKSDNEVVYSSQPSSDFSGSMGVELDLTGKLKLPKEKLKEIYNISIYASNDPEVDGYATDSMLLYVYNAEALDIMVHTAITSNSAAVSGNTVILDNKPYVESLLSTDGSQALDLSEKTLRELREDVNLSALVSINYGAYAWGLLSDQMEWKVDEESTSDAALNYEQGGGYSDIEAGLMPSYLPTSNFMLTATQEGDFALSATHARIPDMVSEITGKVENLKDQLYLFQANPAVKTEVTYYDIEGEKVELETDENGAIAIYEPDGIHSNVYFKAVYKSEEDEEDPALAEFPGDTYLGTKYQEDLLTSERNLALLQVYPVNNIQLMKAAEVSIYLSKPDGTPLKNENVNVRGAAYWNGKYAKKADILKTKDGHADDGNREYSNGLTDQTFKTDSSGTLKMYFDVNQFPDLEYEFKADDHIYYAFELRFYDESGKERYKPEVFEVVERMNSYSQQITLLANENKAAKESFQKNHKVNLFSKGKSFDTFDITYDTVDAVGASEKFEQVILDSTTYLWDYENLIEVDEETKQSHLIDELPDITTGLRDVRTKEILDGQENEIWAYPFSTFPLLGNKYKMNAETYGGVKNAKGEYDWSNAWLAANDEKAVDMVYSEDGRQKQIWPIGFDITNTIQKEEVVDSKQVRQEAVKAVDTLDFDADKLLGQLVPGGDILAKGMAFFSGIGTGGDYTVGLTMVPTADPTLFNMILSIGEQDSDEEDGAKIDYADSTNAKDLKEALGMAEEAKKANKTKGEEDDSESPVEFSFSGCLIARATYSVKDDSWDIMLTGGEVGGKAGIKKEYKQNFFVGPCPITVAFEAKAALGAGFGVQFLPINGGEEAATLTTLSFEAGVEAFAGIGFDYSIIALKLGICGSLSFEATQKLLFTQTIYARNGQYDTNFKQGQHLDIKGEIALKFVAKILFFKYETKFASVGFGWEKSWNQYDDIEEYWEGETLGGQRYSAAAFGSGEILFTIESSGLEDRDYLSRYSRVWISDAAQQAQSAEGWFAALQTNAYPYADPVFSEDGEIIVYLSDAGSEDIEETVACWAKWNGAGFDDKGPIVVKGSDNKEEYGYGDSYLKVAGSDGKYFAAWVQTKESSNLAAVEDTVSENDITVSGNETSVSGNAVADEVTDEDLSVMMRSTEIMAAVFNGKSWDAQRITDNLTPDLAPAIAGNSKGEAILFWRSTYSSSAENPIDFNVEDTIRYTRYDGTDWSDSQIVYTGSNGGVNGLHAVLSEGGAGLAAYTVKAGDREDSKDFETCYSYVTKKGELENVRVTNNETIDENIQAVSVKDIAQDGKEAEAFLLGWYTEDLEGNKDVQMMKVQAEDGSIDMTFPESINSIDNLRVGNNFRFALPKGGDLSDLAIVWVEQEAREFEEADTGEIFVDTLQAVKFCKYDGAYSLTTAQKMAEADVAGSIDYFDVYAESTLSANSVHAVVNMTDYTDIVYADGISIKNMTDELVQRQDYTSDEAYQEAWDSKFAELAEEYPDAVLDIYTTEGEAKIAQASYTFAEKLELLDTSYNKEDVFSGNTIGVTYTVKNTGINPIKRIAIADHDNNQLKAVDGSGKESSTSGPEVLMPGAATSIMVEYPLGRSIADIGFQIQGKTVADADTPEIKGVLEINRPDIGIDSMEVFEEGDGKRNIHVKLSNDSTIPLQGNDKTIEVNFYLDSQCSEDKKLETWTIRPNDNDGTDMQLIDNGAYTRQLQVDVEEVLQRLFKEEDNQTEIPEGGVQLYAKAVLYNNYGTDTQTAAQEEKKTNNEGQVRIQSLTEKAAGDKLSFLNTTINTVSGNNPGYMVALDISNNMMEEKIIGNLLVELLDEEGNVLASKEKYDETLSLSENSISLDKEGRYSLEVSFSEDEIEDADKVVAVNCEVCSDEADVKFDLGGKAVVTGDLEMQTIKLGEKAVKPTSVPVNEDYEFKGWYEDPAYTKKFDFETKVISKNTVIYAKWQSYTPQIMEQPKSIRQAYGTNRKLTVVAECAGNAQMNYQWYKDDKKIEDAIKAEISIRNTDDSGNYYCIVSAFINGKQRSVRSDLANVVITKQNLEVTSDSGSKRYDGKALSKNSYTITKGRVGDGDTLAVTVEGSITEKGSIVNEITEAKIEREGVDVSENYDLTTVNGTLRVTETVQEEYAPLITGQPNAVNITYDGKTRLLMAAAACDYPMSYQWYKNKKAIEGATERTYQVMSVADSGKYYCEVKTVIEGEDTITKTREVSVSIAKRSMTIKADSHEKVYDGKEFRKDSYSYTGTVADGEKLIVTISGLLKKPGKTTNKIESVKVMNGNKDVTSNYDIKTANGTLVVKKGTSNRLLYRANTKSKTEGIPQNTVSYAYGKRAKVAGKPTSNNRFFAGWNTKADGSGKKYKAKSKVKMVCDITLYAQWEKEISKGGLTYAVNSKAKTVTVTGTTEKNKNAVKIKVPDQIKYAGITYKVTKVKKGAFQGMKKLNTVTIGNNVETIEDKAFYNCKKLSKVTIGKSVAKLGKNVFAKGKKGMKITSKSKKIKVPNVK